MSTSPSTGVARRRPRAQRRGQDHPLRILGDRPARHRCRRARARPQKLGYYAQEHENLDIERTVLENMLTAAPNLGETDVRKVLGSFLFTGDDVDKPASVLSGERRPGCRWPPVVSAANVLLLDEPTNNLDPASRLEILSALRQYRGRSSW